jgi:hypothetical protein
MDHLPAMQSQHWGAWPFANNANPSFITTGLRPSHNHQATWSGNAGGSQQSTITQRPSLSTATEPPPDAPATIMSPMGLLQGVSTPAQPEVVTAKPSGSDGHGFIQQLSIQPVLKELPPWLLPVLGLFLGGVGLLAVMATLLLVGATLRHWPAKQPLTEILGVSQTVVNHQDSLAPLPGQGNSLDTFNVSHAQAQIQVSQEPLGAKLNGFAQAPVFGLNQIIMPIKPPHAPNNVAEVIRQTHRINRRLRPAITWQQKANTNSILK